MANTRVEGGNKNKSRSVDNEYQEWSLGAVSLATVVGIVAIFIFSVNAKTVALYFSMSAVALAASGAALLVGGLIGFLFGIPRSRQTEAIPKAEGVNGDLASLYSPNTNLEQISDWLTKILVGVSLTQLPQILRTLDDIGGAVANGLGAATGAKPFAIALTVYFAVAGLLIGYLWTSLYLGRALTEAQRALSLKKQLTRFEEQAHADALALRLSNAQLSRTEPDPTQEELNRAILAASPETRAQIFYRAQAHHNRTWREEATKPLMARAIPIFRALIASDKEEKYHLNYGLLGYCLKDLVTPDWPGANEALKKAIGLRNSDGQGGDWRGYEANRAICLIKLDPAYDKSPSDDALKRLIIADLRAAFEEDWTRAWLEEEPEVIKWLARNAIDPDELLESPVQA